MTPFTYGLPNRNDAESFPPRHPLKYSFISGRAGADFFITVSP